jgi:hypothetical protein
VKSGLTILVLAIAEGSGFGQSRGSVDLYVDGSDASYQLLGPGMPLASDIFRRVGIRLNWHPGELPSRKAGFAIRTVEHAPKSATPEALASSLLTGSAAVEITVYNDRVHRFLEAHGNLKGVGAGYVLAHELAHAMQGVGRHSESGIMKAHWSDLDFQEMVFHKLEFTPEDVNLIHQGLASHLGSVASTQAMNR